MADTRTSTEGSPLAPLNFRVLQRLTENLGENAQIFVVGKIFVACSVVIRPSCFHGFTSALLKFEVW